MIEGICTKKGYDKIGAQIALASCQATGNKNKRQEQRPYKCPQCSAWKRRAVYHLTSKPKRETGNGKS